MNFTKPIGYIQPWRTCKELQWQCFTDFSTVRRQSWCGMDAVLVQFMQLLLRWHSKNLQNSLKKIGSVQHKIELVCYSTGFLTGWDNRPAFKHPVNNLALPVASHRKGLSQNVKQENNSSSIRACCCPLDTHLELTGNTKGTLLMISWRAVSDWHIRVDPVSFPAQVSSSFRAFGRLFFPLLLMWWELWFHHITRSPSSHKVKTSSNYSKTCKKTFTFTTGFYADCCKNCTGINSHSRKAPREKSLTIQLRGKAPIAHRIFRTHCFQFESQCRLFILVHPLLLFELSLVEKQLNCRPPYVWKSWPRWKCQVGYCFSESR